MEFQSTRMKNFKCCGCFCIDCECERKKLSPTKIFIEKKKKIPLKSCNIAHSDTFAQLRSIQWNLLPCLITLPFSLSLFVFLSQENLSTFSLNFLTYFHEFSRRISKLVGHYTRTFSQFLSLFRILLLHLSTSSRHSLTQWSKNYSAHIALSLT